ncbi:sodium:solute symporter family transporter [Komagataeibacter xylinus]|uniref:sodium:solute symporter family protein n=1 Tax=Komagataeibacter xylinus TaxID=28448 RepID=UPI00280C2591|nr:sodium:solute symporter [Komagataeibacter xylinus]
MALLTFSIVIALSLALALFAARGHGHASAKEFFIASGGFGGFLLFFLSVGESYGIGTVIGLPGGIYAHGPASMVWFLGYMLLGYCVGYFLNPWIWRAGRQYDAITLPDLIRAHFNSRALEIIFGIFCLLIMLPVGQMQFTGLILALQSLDIHLPQWSVLGCAALLAFCYVAFAGIRAPAYVSVMKDGILLLSVIAVGGVAIWNLATGHVKPTAFHATSLDAHEQVFAITTIIMQAVAFNIAPKSFTFLFTARSDRTIRRNQILMPLHMLMFPVLIIATCFAKWSNIPVNSANDVFMALARALFSPWLVGIVVAGAALSGLVLLAGLCIAIGPIMTRNLLKNLNEDQQRRGTRLTVAVYLLLSVAGASLSSQLVSHVINLYYAAQSQLIPVVLAFLFFRGIKGEAVVAGLIAGVIVSVGLMAWPLDLWGMNPGFIGVAVNMAVMVAGSMLMRTRAPLPVCLQK